MPSNTSTREAHDRLLPSGSIVYHAISLEGEQELERRSNALAWSGLTAACRWVARSRRRPCCRLRCPTTVWRPLVAKLGADARQYRATLDIFAPALRTAMLAAGIEAMAPAFHTVLRRGIMAGWLIALRVWLLPFAESARVWVIVILTYVIGIGRFSHMIAGSADAMYGPASGIDYWIGDVAAAVDAAVKGAPDMS